MKLVLYLSPENAVFFQLNLFLREQGFFWFFGVLQRVPTHFH